MEEDFNTYKKEKIEKMKSESKSDDEIDNLKNTSISNFLYGLLIENLTYVDSFYAYLVASPLINEFADELDNNRFDNNVFKLYYYIFSSNPSKFITQLKYVKNNYSPNKIDNLVQFFARIYIVHNEFQMKDFDAICSISGINKQKMLPYASREGKIK